MNAQPQFDWLPHNIEAEQALLGAVLMTNDAWDACSELVEADHFFEPLHTKLWTLLGERIMAGQTITPVTLVAQLGSDAGFEIFDGMSVGEYVARLSAQSAIPRHVPAYAGTIRDLWARRRLIALTRDLQSCAMGGEGSDIQGLLDHADSELGAIRFGKQVSGIDLVGDLAETALRQTADAFRLGGAVGFDTGIQSLDEMIGPIMPGDLVTILAPSGHGKSAIAAQILRHNAMPSLDSTRGQAPGLFVSMEMAGTQVARRVMATDSRISAREQKEGRVNQAEYEKLQATAAALRNLPLYIDSSGRQKTSTIVKKLRAMKKAHGIRMAAVDHLLLIQPESAKWSKFDIIDHAAIELKDAAKDLDIAILLLAQVTREAQKRETWRIRDQDLFGGDSVKQASDIFLTVCLPEKWLRQREPEIGSKERGKWDADCERWRDRAEISAPKVRDGDDGSARTVAFDGPRMVFHDLG